MIVEDTCIIIEEFRNVKITVTCSEDLESENGWIEVTLPQTRRQEAKRVAAKLLFMGGKFQTSLYVGLHVK